MSFDPHSHHRRSIRLKDYDYTQPGAYFVTVVAWQRQEIFGQVQAGRMDLSPAGEVVWKVWEDLPCHFHNITLGQAIVMPNHFHGILHLCGRGEASAKWPKGELQTKPAGASPFHGPKETTPCSLDASPLHRPKGTPPCSLGAILQNFKSVISRKIARVMGRPVAPIWQRNYYERVIRDEDELCRITEYILNNPLNWEADTENPHR